MGIAFIEDVNGDAAVGIWAYDYPGASYEIVAVLFEI